MDQNRKEPIRVLQINSGSRSFGGVSSFLYNVYTNIDREQVQFDFLSPNVTTYGIHREEIEEMGGRIYELGIKGNILTRKTGLYKRLYEFLTQHAYSIVHINSGNFFFNLFAVMAVRKAGVPCRIVHSHNAGDTSRSRIKKAVFEALKPQLERNATTLLACSRKAAGYMFTDRTVREGKVQIVKNICYQSVCLAGLSIRITPETPTAPGSRRLPLKRSNRSWRRTRPCSLPVPAKRPRICLQIRL